jgi:nucleotidyltransferase substrate binding protein (TIGR01987 family)
MSTDIRWKQRFLNYSKALAQLQEAVEMEHYTKLESQGLIQCFEYTVELAWKTLQDLIRSKGQTEISGPRPVLKKAFAEGYISDDEGWLTMWENRTITAHTYDETAASQTVEVIKSTYYPLFVMLQERLTKELN